MKRQYGSITTSPGTGRDPYKMRAVKAIARQMMKDCGFRSVTISDYRGKVLAVVRAASAPSRARSSA